MVQDSQFVWLIMENGIYVKYDKLKYFVRELVVVIYVRKKAGKSIISLQVTYKGENLDETDKKFFLSLAVLIL